MFSLEELEPKRPPRLQKFPLDSGTWKFEITCDFAGVVTSARNTIWRFSWHWLARDSLTMTTMSRFLPRLFLAKSGIVIPGIGKVVWAPPVGARSRRPSCGARRSAEVGF